MRRQILLFSLVAAATVIVDQLSKAAVRASLSVGESITLVPDWFYLTYVRNEGAAFGLLPGWRPMFLIVHVLVLVGVGIYFWRTRGSERPTLVVVALGFITGGALGNLIDRVALGRVTDFFDAAIINFPVFNVADIGISVGTAILVVWLLFFEEPHPDVAPPPDAGPEDVA